jgi:hypothetical protein
MKPRTPMTLLAALCLVCPVAMAQSPSALDDWGFDPGVLAASGSDLLRRAPDGEVDALFQAVHAAAREDGEAQAMCALFEPDADRSLDGLNAAATQLRPASRERFAAAIANALVAAVQSPPQAFDAGVARQSLKSAGVTAAILHEGFVGGLNATGNDPATRSARCQSLRWLLDAMQSRPPTERAAMTRLLLDEGLVRLAADG